MLPLPLPRIPSVRQTNSLMLMLISWLALPWDAFFRHSHGPAYFTAKRLMGFLSILFIYDRVTGFRTTVNYVLGVGAIGDGRASHFLPILGVMVIAGSVHHLRQIARRAQAGAMIYPDSAGISHLDLGNGRYRFDAHLPGSIQLTHWRVYRFVEPLLACIIAAVFWMIDREFGVFLLISAFAYLARNQIVHADEQEELFNWQRRRIRHAAFEKQLQSPDIALDPSEFGGYVPMWLPPTQRQAFAQDMLAQEPLSTDMPVITLIESPAPTDVTSRPQFTQVAAS